jgi:long-chain acyl-CoA synthetase
MFEGYLDDPAPTEATRADGWLRTGDLGSLDEKGRVIIRERSGDLLRTADGTEVAPRDIEAELRLSSYVSDAVVVARGRPWPAALIQVEYDTVGAWAARRNLPFTTFASLSALPEVHALIEQEVKTATAHLPESAQIRSVALIERPLTPARGEVTPARTLRRDAIERAFADEVEALYARDAVAR